MDRCTTLVAGRVARPQLLEETKNMSATVSIVGAGGRVGSTAAFVLQLAGIAQQINLIDVVEGNVLDVVRARRLISFTATRLPAARPWTRAATNSWTART
jgi:hypothetical protein